MASLIVTNGKQEGDYYPLGRRTNVVGRDEALPIQILDNMVSRKHLQIRFDPATKRYFAYDMKSRNGVYVNNRRVEDEVALKDGDVIMVGMTSTCSWTGLQGQGQRPATLQKVGERKRVTTYGPREFDLEPVGPGETAHPVPHR